MHHQHGKRTVCNHGKGGDCFKSLATGNGPGKKLLHEIHVGVQRPLGVAGEHVVVHVDGATVVDGVAKSLGHDLHAAVHGQAQLEEARLRSGQGVHPLK